MDSQTRKDNQTVDRIYNVKSAITRIITKAKEERRQMTLEEKERLLQLGIEYTWLKEFPAVKTLDKNIQHIRKMNNDKELEED